MNRRHAHGAGCRAALGQGGRHRLLPLALGALIWSLAGPLRADDAEALLAQLSLPPREATVQVIAALPQVQAARAGMALAEARGQQLEAGPHEWTLRAGSQRRIETDGAQLAETELALERGVRWGGKAQTDREIGAAGVEAGESAYADAWHEAVRGLLQAWYDWQRERGAAGVQAAQAALAQEQLRVAERRVLAGEAARMDQLMAQADRDRALAAQQQSSGRAQVLQQELQQRFPGLQLDTDAAQAAPPPLQLPGEPQAWLQSIVAHNHEVELAEAQMRIARLHSERAQLDTRPDPLLGVRAARERGGQEQVFGVYMTIPFAGTYRQAEVRAAGALLTAAEQRLDLTRQRVQTQAQRVVSQAGHAITVWQRLAAVQQATGSVAQLAMKAYGLGELTLSEALQARRTALEAALAADAARWDAQEAVSRVLVDAHRLWPAEEHGH